MWFPEGLENTPFKVFTCFLLVMNRKKKLYSWQYYARLKLTMWFDRIQMFFGEIEFFTWISFSRYSAQSKLSEAEDLLYDGAVELFKKKQISSGTDLSKLYIEVLEKRDDRTEDEREKVHIFSTQYW